MAKQRSDLLTARVLRGFAALLVVAFHSVYSCMSGVLGSTVDPSWPKWTTHVGIFFTMLHRSCFASTVAAAE